MTKASSYVLGYAAERESFSCSELMDSTDSISRSSLNWALVQLESCGELSRIGHGVYAKSSKQRFAYSPGEDIKRLFESLKAEYPLAHFCIYGGDIFEPLQHHLSYNALTYVEADKSLTEILFHKFQDAGQKVFHKPSKELFYDYVDISSPAIIVKQLISGAPLNKGGKVPVPTLEKLLVDIRRDSDLDYLSEQESLYMLATAADIYNINRSSLLRYAGRRGIREEFEADLKRLDDDK